MTRDENSAPCKASLRLYGTQNAMGIQIYKEDEKMEKGYYLCKVLKVDTPYKKIHNAQINLNQIKMQEMNGIKK